VTLSEIQQAIESLPEEEQSTLAEWLAERDRAHWDAELQRDFSRGGAGMKLLDHVKEQVRKGRSRPFSEGPPTR